MKLIIKGKPSYVERMYKHLRKEHPSTRGRMYLKKRRKDRKRKRLYFESFGVRQEV